MNSPFMPDKNSRQNNGVVQFGGHSTEYNSTDVTYFNVQRYTDYNNELIYWSTYINRVDFSLNTNEGIQVNTVYVQNYAVYWVVLGNRAGGLHRGHLRRHWNELYLH